MTTTTDELVYRYVAASSLRDDGGRLELDLATSGGCGPNPWLAEGFLRAPQTAARALLLVANVAGARFWTPPNMVAAAIEAADPVVTTSRVALRFESFSRCCGVYARFDLDAAALDGTVHSHGTTNVDVNPPLRASLARIGPRDPLHLRVGHDELAVSTLDGRVVEKRVPLPERWVRGFAEVAVATSTLEPTLVLSNAALRQFLQQLPRGGSRGVGWVVPSGTGARLSTRHAPGALAVGGIERLRVLREMAPFIRSVTAFGRQGGSGRARAARAPCGRSTSKVATSRSRSAPSRLAGSQARAVCSTHPRTRWTRRWRPRPRGVSATTCNGPSGSRASCRSAAAPSTDLTAGSRRPVSSSPPRQSC